MPGCSKSRTSKTGGKRKSAPKKSACRILAPKYCTDPCKTYKRKGKTFCKSKHPVGFKSCKACKSDVKKRKKNKTPKKAKKPKQVLDEEPEIDESKDETSEINKASPVQESSTIVVESEQEQQQEQQQEPQQEQEQEQEPQNKEFDPVKSGLQSLNSIFTGSNTEKP